jgi:hypothetical protein
MKGRLTHVLLFAALSGCAGESDDTDKQLAKVEGFCEKWGEHVCNGNVVDQCSAADRQSCREAQAAFCEDLVPSGKYSSEHAEPCLEAVQIAYEDAQLTAEERDVVRFLGGACHPVVSGSGSEGDPCEVTADCSVDADLSCVRKPGEEMGSCQIAEEVEGGRRCSGDTQICASGFYCDGTNCLASHEGGEPCSADVPCADAFKCEALEGGTADADGGVVETVCVERVGTGQSCGKNEDCMSAICAMATGASGGVCASRIILSATDPICDDLR